MALTQQDFQSAANALKCDIRAIRAVDDVESGGNGFLPTGALKILFEGSQFWERLQEKGIKPVLSDICFPKWKMYPYGKESEQWAKLKRAMVIDTTCAYKATSWGRYQPMGKYFAEMGYDTVFAMVKDFQTGEAAQLNAFVKMIKFRKLDDELRNQDWATLALHYNGSGQVQLYAGKLKAAFDAAT